MKIFRYIAVIATLGIGPMSLQAMALNFDLTGRENISLELMSMDQGYSLTASAKTEFGDVALVSQNMTGAGVCLMPTDCGAGMLDIAEVDSENPEEIISFAVSSAFTLTGLYFADLDIPDENFDLIVDDVVVGSFNPTANPWYLADAGYSPQTVTEYFAIHARQVGGTHSAFRISNVFGISDTYAATALPEPGTLGMLVFGLALVGLIRRRKLS